MVDIYMYIHMQSGTTLDDSIDLYGWFRYVLHNRNDGSKRQSEYLWNIYSMEYVMIHPRHSLSYHHCVAAI